MDLLYTHIGLIDLKAIADESVEALEKTKQQYAQLFHFFYAHFIPGSLNSNLKALQTTEKSLTFQMLTGY